MSLHRTRRCWFAPLVGAVLLLATGLAVSQAAYTSSTTSAGSAASASAWSYSASVTASTPIAWWRFGDTSGTTTADSAGTYTGTVSTAGLVRGVPGAVLQDASTAFRLDGVAGCVSGATLAASSSPFTLEAWFRSSSPQGGFIVGSETTGARASGDASHDRQVYLTPAGNVAFAVRPAAASVVTSPGRYADGQWHLVHATLGAGGQSLYVDGVLVASSATTSSSGAAAALHAGCGTVDPAFAGAPATGYLRGDVDEVALYASALSAATIASRFTAAPSRQTHDAAVQAARPWGWYRLAESSGTTLTDSSGNANAGTTGGTLTRLQDGVVAGNTATTFNGSTGCAVVSTAVTNPTTFSLEAWFKTTSTAGGWLVGLSANAAATSANQTHDRNVYLTNSGQVVYGTWNGASADVITSALAYNDGGWHHVVATQSSAGQRLYVDGGLVGSSAVTATSSYTGRWKIGCDYLTGWPSAPSSAFLAGTIDEVAVYQQALDAQTVLRHVQAASVVPSYATQVAAASPWLWWRLGEQGGGTMVPDASGNGRHGVAMAGGLRRGVPGITDDDSATRFDGSSGCVVSSASAANPTTFSLEAWIRTTTTSGGWIIGFSGESTPVTTGNTTHDRNMYLTNTGTLVFGTWNGTTADTVTTASAYNDGAWHHLVATLSAAGQRLYVDGALAASSAVTTAENSARWWKVGCGQIGNAWPSKPSSFSLDGTIDEAAVYATALDATTVAAHYRAGTASLAQLAEKQASTPWASWRLGEASGTALADASGSGHTATASATGTTAGAGGVLPDDRARSFDGATGCAVSDASTTSPATFSVELWFKGSGNGGALIGFSDASTPNVSGVGYDRLVYVDDTGRVNVGVYSGSTLVVTSSATFLDGQWHQAMATFGTAGGQRLYVDGVLQASRAYSAPNTYTGWWHVGCSPLVGWPNQPASAYFPGTIDEVAVHTVELDAATIAYRYALANRPLASYATTARARIPTLHWTLDQTAGNATDASGNGVTGTVSGSGITRQQVPAVGTGLAWAFDGSAGCIVSASSFANPTTFTEELWFRTTSTTGAGLMAFTINAAANTTATQWDRLLYLRDNGTVSFAIFNAGARPVITSTAAYNDGQWHHVAASVGPNGMRLHVDGALVASNAASGVESFTGYWHAGCGKYGLFTGAPTNQYLNGDLDEVAIHPVQLADETVRQHYLAGAAQRPNPINGAAIISTILGTGTASDTGDGGAATSATVNTPYDVATDAYGNIYVAGLTGACRVRKISPDGVVSAFAGTGTCSTTGDGGAATSATINEASGVAVGPDGSVYIAEGNGYRVRKVSPAGIITTIAGNGVNTTAGDGGAATSASLYLPRGVAVDVYGNVYVGARDSNRVRKITPAGVISTFIGNGTASSTGDGGQASSATVNYVYGVATGPDGSVYVAEYNGCRVRKVTAAGVVSTVAGTGTCSSSGDGGAATSATIWGPHGVAADPYGNLYIAERSGHRVRKVDANGTITTLVGNGVASSSGDGGAGSSATVNEPRGLALDPDGRLLIVDGNGYRLRRLG